MYQSELLDAYKKAQNYVQDKQIAMDLNQPKQRISEFRKGKGYINALRRYGSVNQST